MKQNGDKEWKQEKVEETKDDLSQLHGYTVIDITNHY